MWRNIECTKCAHAHEMIAEDEQILFREGYIEKINTGDFWPGYEGRP